MKMKKIVILATGLLASACSVTEQREDIDQNYANTKSVSDSHISRADKQTSKQIRKERQIVDRPYITGRSVPLSQDVTLPAALRGEVDTVMIYKDDADLLSMANRIREATGINVEVKPDALLPLNKFLPRLDDVDDEDMATPAPLSVEADTFESVERLLNQETTSSRTNIPTSTQPLTPSGKKTLPNILDAIALRLGVYWEFDHDANAISFYRTKTRTFELRGMEFSPEWSAGVELRNGVEQNTSGINSGSNANIELSGDPEDMITAITNRVQTFMTRAGQVSYGANGLMIVTDTKDSLDKIETYIEQENKIRSRRVEIKLEEITLEKTQSDQVGVDWDLIFNSSGNSTQVDVSGLNSLLEQEGNPISANIGLTGGNLSGTSVALQALSQIGKVVDRKTTVIGGNNHQPITVGSPERQSYISKLEQTQSFSDSSAPTVTVTQEEIVSGRIITFLPSIYPDGTINVGLKYDNTPTPVLEKQTLPDGSYVQSPFSKSDVMVRTLMTKPGQPVVVNAKTSTLDSYDQKGVDQKAPMFLGGSATTDRTERATVLVMTTMAQE